VPETSTPEVPSLNRISPPPSDDDGEATETEQDKADDSPPAFPSLNSAQRVKTQKNPSILTDTQLMPPPPFPGLAVRTPGVPSRAAPSGPSSLAVPPTTTKVPAKPSKKREKVALAPGHSPLDWAALKSSGQDLRVSLLPWVYQYDIDHPTFREWIHLCGYHRPY
jgi:hypothetical protein